MAKGYVFFQRTGWLTQKISCNLKFYNRRLKHKSGKAVNSFKRNLSALMNRKRIKKAVLNSIAPKTLKRNHWMIDFVRRFIDISVMHAIPIAIKKRKN